MKKKKTGKLFIFCLYAVGVVAKRNHKEKILLSKLGEEIGLLFQLTDDFLDIKGSKKLNKKLLEVISNYVPDVLVLGHADLIKIETLHYIKQNYPSIKMCQWFLDRMDSEWINNKRRFLN